MPRPKSDHPPIFLVCERKRKDKSPFRFENMWVKVEGCRGLVKEWCQKYEYRGSPSVVLFNKMQALKDLKL